MSFNLISISILSLLDCAGIKYEISQSGQDVKLKLIGKENQLYGFCYASICDILRSSMKVTKLNSNEIKFTSMDSCEDIMMKLNKMFEVAEVCLPKVILKKNNDTKRHVYSLSEFCLN